MNLLKYIITAKAALFWNKKFGRSIHKTFLLNILITDQPIIMNLNTREKTKRNDSIKKYYMKKIENEKLNNLCKKLTGDILYSVTDFTQIIDSFYFKFSIIQSKITIMKNHRSRKWKSWLTATILNSIIPIDKI